MKPPLGVRCSFISERFASRGVNPSLLRSPHMASGSEVVIGALPSSRDPTGAFLKILSLSPPNCADEEETPTNINNTEKMNAVLSKRYLFMLVLRNTCNIVRTGPRAPVNCGENILQL